MTRLLLLRQTGEKELPFSIPEHGVTALTTVMENHPNEKGRDSSKSKDRG